MTCLVSIVAEWAFEPKSIQPQPLPTNHDSPWDDWKRAASIDSAPPPSIASGLQAQSRTAAVHMLVSEPGKPSQPPPPFAIVTLHLVAFGILSGCSGTGVSGRCVATWVTLARLQTKETIDFQRQKMGGGEGSCLATPALAPIFFPLQLLLLLQANKQPGALQ